MSRVVVYEPASCATADVVAVSEPHDVVSIHDARRLLEDVTEHPPDALVFMLSDRPDAELGFLKLTLRACPDLAFVLVTPDDSLDARRKLLGFQPIYWIVGSPAPEEMADAVRAALEKTASLRASRRRRVAGAG